jgi:nicotinate phosphoribosyltransferase
MKITECNGLPVAKISNTPGKGMCRDNDYVDYLTRCINWRLNHE